MAWQYDPMISKVEWAVRYLGIATVKGRFTRVQATLNLDDPDPTRWSLEATIDAASLSSGHDAMDDHVRTADFLDVERFPTISYTSKRIEKPNGTYRVSGDLTLRGVTREVVLEGTFGGEATDSRGRTRRGFSGQTTIKRSDFGIPSGKAGDVFIASEEVRVTLEVVATKVD